EDENLEVVVKLVRLLANLSLDPDLGKAIVGMLEIEGLIDLLERYTETHEELTLNIVGAMANFTYYVDDGVLNVLVKRRVEIAGLLLPLLLHPNTELLTQASRVFGNLSRFADVQSVLAQRRGTEVFTVLLDHSCRDVVFNACGVLINLLRPKSGGGGSAGVHGRIVLEGGGVEKLLEAFQSSIEDVDLQLLNVVGRALHNLRSHSEGPLLKETQVKSDLVPLLESVADLADCWSNQEDPLVEEVRDLVGRLAADFGAVHVG
ncbi:Armadillo repeat-containing protein 2, partial [Rhizophlyctis rosea]